MLVRPPVVLALAALAAVACDAEAANEPLVQDVPEDSSAVPGDSLEALDIQAAAGDPRGMLPNGPGGFTLPSPSPTAAIKAPLPAAYCQINVNGVNHATETDYLPHVIHCENGGAPFEALKAQAIAARSVAYYAMANDGKICDGQGCQVYSCGSEPTQQQKDAVLATAGQYLSYNGWLTYAFFVAGDSKTAAPSCVDTNNNTASATEKWVTFNNGKSNYDVDQTGLGFKFPEDKNVAGYGQNRGCMSQWGARCLEKSLGKKSTDIIKFYYGADIKILQAAGACVKPPNKPAKGTLDEVSCAQISGWAFDGDSGAAAIKAKISFDANLGEPNATTITVTANQERADLCDVVGSCAHGFTHAVPRSLMDNEPHPVHAHAIDPEADPVQLADSPKDLVCPPPALPPGVRRHVSDPMVLANWQFDPFWQMARVDDATLQAIPEWQIMPNSPLLMRVEGDPAIWLSDNGFRRHVPSQAIAAAWKLDLASAVVWEAADLMMVPEGTPLRPEPFLVGGPGPAVYVLDDPQCLPEGDPNDPLCPPPPDATTSGGETSGDETDATGETGGGGETGSTGGAPQTSGPDPTTPTEGGGSVSASAGESSGEVDSGGASSGGPGQLDSGPALPPGYGDDGACAVDVHGRAPSGLLLLGLLLVRRRRRAQ